MQEEKEAARQIQTEILVTMQNHWYKNTKESTYNSTCNKSNHWIQQEGSQELQEKTPVD